ncbi:hypothetical protein [Botrimarina sp.]|uniref:hypothetical protein n=1 Tax=Botrimarina sp. TaxID=2795802 RepID=UPI0032EE7EB9
MFAAFTIPAAAEAIALFGVTTLLGALLFYWTKRLAPSWRDAYGQGAGDRASELMSQFRDLHERGGLSTGEFQHIKAKLAPLLQAENSAAAAQELSADARQTLREATHFVAERQQKRAAGAPSPGEGRAAQSEQREPSGAAGGAARGGCDAAPPAGGDSTREDR